jgi:hypothetical protein
MLSNNNNAGLVWFLFGVETHGRTLEELDEVFNAKFPPSASLKKTTMVRRGNGHLQELDEQVPNI